MEELRTYFLFTGLGISLTSFALKVALGLQFLKNFKERALFVSFYVLLFVGAIFLVKALGEELNFLFERGYLLHLLMAFGLILWFLFLFTRRSSCRLSLLAVALPCPVCLASMGLSALIYERLSGDKAGAYILLPLTFLFLLIILYFLIKKVLLPLAKAPLEDLLALFMLFAALYLLGSFYFPAKIEELRGFNFVANIHPGIRDLIIPLIYSLIFIFLGYFAPKNKGQRS